MASQARQSVSDTPAISATTGTASPGLGDHLVPISNSYSKGAGCSGGVGSLGSPSCEFSVPTKGLQLNTTPSGEVEDRRKKLNRLSNPQVPESVL